MDVQELSDKLDSIFEKLEEFQEESHKAHMEQLEGLKKIGFLFDRAKDHDRQMKEFVEKVEKEKTASMIGDEVIVEEEANVD